MMFVIDAKEQKHLEGGIQMSNDSEIWFDEEFPRDGSIDYYVWRDMND